MKRIIITLLTLMICADFSFAQWGKKQSSIEYNHALGIGYLIALTPAGNAGLPLFSYFPRLNVVRFSSDATLSVDVPVSFTAWGNSYTGTTVYYDFAVAANFNYGLAATKNSKSKFGFYTCLGLGYYPIKYEKKNLYDPTKTTWSDNTTAIYFSAGFRFPSLKKMPQAIGLYTGVGFNDVIIFGFNVRAELGQKTDKRKY
ncbi:MAG: hypothetical protein HY958_12710 [Bacteroidia bacterium]|nr:hypothetical protein [Bacteroidia bacterium]